MASSLIKDWNDDERDTNDFPHYTNKNVNDVDYLPLGNIHKDICKYLEEQRWNTYFQDTMEYRDYAFENPACSEIYMDDEYSDDVITQESSTGSEVDGEVVSDVVAVDNNETVNITECMNPKVASKFMYA